MMSLESTIIVGVMRVLEEISGLWRQRGILIMDMLRVHNQFQL
jgi:hypothetical protein